MLCQVFDIRNGCLNLSLIFLRYFLIFPLVFLNRAAVIAARAHRRDIRAAAAAASRAWIRRSHLAARRDQKWKNILQNTSLLIPRAERTRVHTNARNKRDAIEAHKYTADLLRVIHFSTDSVNVC